MSLDVLPVAKALFVCDAALIDPAKSKISILNAFDSVRPEPGESYPYLVRRMCVACRLTGGIGDVSFHVQVVSAQDLSRVFHSRRVAVHFPSRTKMVTFAYGLLNCPFPQAGVYFVELFADNQFVEDVRLTLQEPSEDLP